MAQVNQSGCNLFIQKWHPQGGCQCERAVYQDAACVCFACMTKKSFGVSHNGGGDLQPSYVWPLAKIALLCMSLHPGLYDLNVVSRWAAPAAG
ncbi:hypothetical protein HaLaN_05289, partial [Haematococcus lacustris]